ncbi:MAG: HEAT repeat domain-containing protein [Phycisphaerae bacterium]|nr:HEAT repeat domain-containing protein [Phycisphaerae bacterium]
MKTIHIAITAIASVLLFSLTLNAKEPAPSNATEVIEHYLKMPFPQKDQHDLNHQNRHAILRQLINYPDQAIPALTKILPTLKDARQRKELTEFLRYFPTQPSADLACKMLKDTDDIVRSQAIGVLRLMARRTDRIGPQRTIRPRPLVKINPAEKEKNIRQQLANKAKGKSTPPKKDSPKLYDEFPPQVDGLVPHLIEAANDTSFQNRIFALYALADTRDPPAVVTIRKCLKDPHEKVRINAACFLTEYNDNASLPELKRAVIWLNKTKPTDQFDYYWTAEKVLASLERITKKSFGEIPMNPGLHSHSGQADKSAVQYQYLIKRWANYFQDQETQPSKSVKTDEEVRLEKLEIRLREQLATGWTPPWKSLNIPFTYEQINKMPTKELGVRLWATGLYARESLIFDHPNTAMKRLEVFHKGYTELFNRPDLWEAIVAGITVSSTQLSPSKPDKENLNRIMALTSISDTYEYPPVKRNIAGHEKELINAHIRALSKIKTFVEEMSGSTPSCISPRVAIRLCESALVLAKNYAPIKADSAGKKMSQFKWPKENFSKAIPGYIDQSVSALNRLVG